jgi:hypothetical protein
MDICRARYVALKLQIFHEPAYFEHICPQESAYVVHEVYEFTNASGDFNCGTSHGGELVVEIFEDVANLCPTPHGR